MNYSRAQKFLSFLVIFSLFFSITFRVPIFHSSLYAKTNDYRDIVSILVNENVYSKIRSEVEKYADDIWSVLDNTQVIILPTPSNATSYQIASLNESLYFDGIKGLKKSNIDSRLVGTVLVWDIPTPIVTGNESSDKTILPYTDFKNKSYIFDETIWRYIVNSDSNEWIKPEIWHWVISPNTGSEKNNIQALKDYFAKNHEYYTGSWNFKLSTNVINGDKRSFVPSTYEPYVFYFDAFRESQSINFNNYIWYRSYLNFKEDIVYKRYTKALATLLQSEMLWDQNRQIWEIADKVNLGIDVSALSNGPDVSISPDIQTRHIVKNSIKKFVEIFSKGSIWTFRWNVHNAWRYNQAGSKVNVDLIPHLITSLDLVSDKIILDTNNDLESYINTIVTSGLARKIAIPTTYRSWGAWYNDCISDYENFLFGQQTKDITNASECTIYRWSTENWWKLVEANRWHNVHNVKSDVELATKVQLWAWANAHKMSLWYWWGNSALNLDNSSAASGKIKLWTSDTKKSIRPLFDIAGSVESKNALLNPSPLQCYNTNMLLTSKEELVRTSWGWWSNGSGPQYECKTRYTAPVNGIAYSKNNNNWNPLTLTTSWPSIPKLKDVYKNISVERCTRKNINLDWVSIDSASYVDSRDRDWDYECSWSANSTTGSSAYNNWHNVNYNYKWITSHIIHNAPTAEQLSEQVSALITPDLPVNKDRYIDFIAADGDYAKIKYPNLFRVNTVDVNDLSFASSKEELKKHLDWVTTQMNTLITNHNPSKLSWKNQELYNLLKIWSYPTTLSNTWDKVSLYSLLKDKKSNGTINDYWDKKNVNYLDTLAFAVHWNNLNSVSAKYKFIFENYLSDQFDNDFNFNLPKNKKLYEIAYLAWFGDASNMYVKVDPESKAENPYADIISKNLKLSSALLWVSVSRENNKSKNGTFKCAPPEWVMIFEWIPAIMCWLTDMLPPAITISEWTCWVTLLSPVERDEFEQCNWDVNKNGVNDCIEKKFDWWKIILSSDASNYYFQKSGKLTAKVVDKKGVQVRLDNVSKVDLKLQKVETLKDTTKEFTNDNVKTIYDRGDVTNNKYSQSLPYIDFNDTIIPVTWGQANFGFSSKAKEANYYFTASISVKDKDNKEFKKINSEPLKIEIRSDRIFASSYVAENILWDVEIQSSENMIEASEEKNIYFFDAYNQKSNEIIPKISKDSKADKKLIFWLNSFNKNWVQQKIRYPLTIQVQRNNINISEPIVINKESISNFISLWNYQESWNYTLSIVDKSGQKIEKDFVIEAAAPSEIVTNMWATVTELWWAVTSNVSTVLDRFWNPVVWKFYELEAKISWTDTVFEENNTQELSGSVFEWYKIFRLKTNAKTWVANINFILKDNSGKELLKSSKKLNVLKQINLSTQPLGSNFKVWWGEYSFKVSLRGETWSILSDYNGRIYFTISDIYWNPKQSYFELKNGEAIVSFFTGTVAWKDISVEFQAEWLSKIAKRNITIYPDKAIKVDLSMSSDKVEAKDWDVHYVKTELKDRYGNVVFNDNSTQTKIEILQKYKSIIWEVKSSATVKWWTSTLWIAVTDTPGVGYFKISTSPSLSWNNFIIKDGGKDVTISGAWENVWKLETFFFWNKKTIDKTKYNALYSTLLWANYWDYSQKDYLAGSLLFNRNNRALAVTSLLNNPYNYNDVLSLLENGSIQNISASEDLSQDIVSYVEIDDNFININYKNDSLNSYVGKFTYRFDDKVITKLCPWSTFNACINEDKTSGIYLQSVNDSYKTFKEWDKLVLRDSFWKIILTINKDWSIDKNWILNISVSNSGHKYAIFEIIVDTKIVAKLAFNMKDYISTISRDNTLFKNKSKTLKNAVIGYLSSNSYSSRELSSNNGNQINIFYNDPFAADYTLNEFSKSNQSSYENSVKEWGLWWSEANKTLLNFSAWSSVWESVKEYQSFSVINLWDPVVSLKKIRKKLPKTSVNRKFDSTIGNLISDDDKIESYQVFDYNNDNLDDILIVQNDDYLRLYENTETSEFVQGKWYIAQVADLSSPETLKAWDFTWDGYDDIFFVNDKKEPFLLNNNEKDFYRINLTKAFNLNGKVVQSEVFDMDADGIKDVVILDDSWEINVFYGWGTWENPKFTKLNIWKDYAITLDSAPRTDKWAVYYEGIVSKSSKDFKKDKKSKLANTLANLQNNISSQQNGSTWEWSSVSIQSAGINDELADSIIFTVLPYWTEIVAKNSATWLLETLELPNSPELWDSMAQTQESLKKFLEENKSNIDINATYKKTKQVSFLRSEYSEIAWVQVKKVYNDANGKPLQSDDYIDVTVTIQNTSNKTLKKFAYADESLEIFEFDRQTLTVEEWVNISTDIAGYNFIIDGFDLKPNESKTFSYKLKTYPIKYWNIQVGKFEKWSAWDDNYGDVLFKWNKENCSQASDILASIWTRSYKKEITNPQCDSDKLKLPDVLEQNKQDENNNGVPDYIDKLVNGSTAEKEKYASEQLAKMNKDSDGDGIPDSDDDSNFAWSLTSNLDKMSENVNGVLEWVDTIMQGLSCWFGWGWCIATPMNWAPLAPGWDPTLFGYPVWDWLMVGEWIPTISWLTGINVPTPVWCYQVPTVWPMSPLMFTWVCNAALWAGWYLGTISPTNTFRIFVTPTLTWAVGMAACFGWPPIVAWYANMPGMHPLVPGWNCVIAAMPLIGCEDDGSDWDIASTWFAQTSAGWFGIYNWNCSWASKQNQSNLSPDFVKEYFDYKKTWKVSSDLKDKFKDTFTKVAKPNNTPTQNFNNPLINMNGQGTWDEVSVNVDFSSIKAWNFADIIKIQKQKISDFPSFLMSDWVERQIEEIVTKLTDFPTLYIILPDFSGILDTGTTEWKDVDDVVKVDKNITWLVWTGAINTANSWMKEAYAFLSNIPLVNISQESVNINLPWVDEPTIEKTIILRNETLDGRKAELERAKNEWSFGALCNEPKPEDQKACEDKNAASEKIILQTEGLIRSLEQNIEVIQSYKDLPKDINTLINSKEKYIEQVMCNVESIGEILWGWIGKNGERFKAWVELYVLIKAILKSWQLMVDIFIDYEAECHECKNERGDLQAFIWELISAVIPEMPIILFPKWPDIIMDLHNIRAWLDIALPEFKFASRPIILPLLPDLILPNVPTVNINLPTLPILPTIELPELPDLPSLPTVELPNLPPPPTLPKLFASLEWVVDILKLITKAMCLLKTSPFVPEWRAGDQIAFITERQWYLPTDFLNLSLPQFSYPFVDAIKVTSYVNLEFETDFIIQLAEQIAMPINSFSNDATRVLDIQVSDLDFSRVIPTQIDVNLDGSSNIETEISQENIMKNVLALVIFAKAWIEQGLNHLEENKNITVSNTEFKQTVFDNLASAKLAADPKFDKLRNVWNEVDNYSYSKENKYIKELENNNYEKFETLKNILSTELQRTKEESKNIQKLLEPKYTIPVSKTESRITAYNDALSKYNDKFIQSAHNLIEAGDDEYKTDLQEKGTELLAAVSSPIDKYRAAQTWTWSWAGKKPASANTCSASNNSDYGYTYKGLYVVEDDTSYRLFDYLEEVDGDEQTTVIDLDSDGDEDLLYMSKWAIYFKENLDVIRTNKKDYNTLTFSSDDNKFFSWEFIPAVNNFNEISIDSGSINMKFKASTNSDINNYRVEYYPIIDKFENENNDSYRPNNAKKSIIDAFSNTENTLLDSKLHWYSLYSNLAYINNAWTLNWLTIETPSLTNITKNLSENTVVNISVWTAVYAWKQSVTLDYRMDGSEELFKVLIPKYSHVVFDATVKVLWANNAAYIQNTNTLTYNGEEIRLLLWKPLWFGTKIWFKNDKKWLSEKSYVDIKYFDGSEANLHFTNIERYELYNLGYTAESHVIRVNQENDYYYAKAYAFRNNKYSTSSKLTLLAPQVVADDNSPELSLAQVIRIPVYQKQVFDFTPFIYEDGWIKNIHDFWIDMDPKVDDNNDGNPRNDKSVEKVSIQRTLAKITAEFWEYDSIFEKEISIWMTDANGNTLIKDINFEVYSPVPEIETVNNETITGYINEDLEKEPVRLFRVRWGVITPIQSADKTKETLTEKWEYNFPISKEASWLTLTQNGTTIAEIDETTWKITAKQVWVKISAYSSNDVRNKWVYPSINVIKNNQTVYNQEIKVWNTTHTELVENFELGDKHWLFVKFLDKSTYNYYLIPETVSYNPGSLVIYRNSDVHKEPLFIIYKDGRIDTINGNYKLEYSHESDYIILRLVDAHFAKTVAEVMYKVQWEYIMQ